jgi:hypothetical protein
MEINRSNYEIWFIDFLDGKLNNLQIEQLNSFLSENADLQEEMKEIGDLRLTPPEVLFSGKNRITKGPSEMNDLQFDLLCAGFIENDLNIEELTVLNSIILNDRKREKELNVFKKLKLSPPYIRFSNKKLLLRNTHFQKARPLAVTLLSTAASIGILIALYFNLSGETRIKGNDSSKLVKNEGRAEHSMKPQIAENNASGKYLKVEKSLNSFPPVNRITAASGKNNLTTGEEEKHVLQHVFSEIIQPVEVLNNKNIKILNTKYICQNDLISLSLSNGQPDAERGSLSRFLAKVFREKILRENTIDDSPIKGYEIAEVGVSGLNKLLGWEMALEKNTNENGEIKSVYFSSRILKIHAPVNKTGSGY